MQQIKKYITDFRFIAATIALVYAICTHVFIIEGLPSRVQKLEEWREQAEQYHHKVDLAIIQSQSSITNIEAQVTRITEWIFNGRTTH